MLKDITIGQFLPVNSAVHRLDPRTKIILVIAFIVAVFMVESLVSYALVALFLAVTVKLSKIPFKMIGKSLKPILIFIIITALINLFMTDGKILFKWGFLRITYEGVMLTVKMSLRLIFLVTGTSILTYTTSPIVLTDGIETLMRPLTKIKVPAHEIAMMMTIALRFIPTIIDETDKIMKAQAARGSDFESGSLMKRAKALIPILVPLFISAFRRADDLAVAMECRCYRGGESRTKMNSLKFGKSDFLCFFGGIVFFAAVLVINYFTR